MKTCVFLFLLLVYATTLAQDDKTGTIKVKKPNQELDIEVDAPEIFSPNGDGFEDTWIPQIVAKGNHTFTLRIMDKKGNIVYQFSDPNNPWDGTIKNKRGKNNQAKHGDTFSWLLTVRDEEGNAKSFGGKVTVIIRKIKKKRKRMN
ncbi:MAG: hypothetical protein COA57_07715 [Flavobacteriales bacterium]|nr:MAG: hypothetical protein COA57_07715 [Flavobacteriales bacterium]